MPYSLTYNDLPTEIEQWPGLPLSLSGEEVMPLDYSAGNTGWLLYARELDKKKLTDFQQRFGLPIVVVSAWKIEGYHVVRLAGAMPKQAKKIAEDMALDSAKLGNIPQLNMPGLLLMDMDSTAIQIECIDELAKLAGVSDKVVAITEQAMRGELDFTLSLKKRVALLKDLDVSYLDSLRSNLPLTSGLISLVNNLKEFGWYVAIASGGFTHYADYLKEVLQLDAAVANKLELKNGKLTGKVIGPIVDAKYKMQVLVDLAKEYDIPMQQTVAIGDGANDIKMIQAAGLGVAFDAKPKVWAKADMGIRYADLIGVLCVLSASLNREES